MCGRNGHLVVQKCRYPNMLMEKKKEGSINIPNKEEIAKTDICVTLVVILADTISTDNQDDNMQDKHSSTNDHLP